jgi:hypothetical protein
LRYLTAIVNGDLAAEFPDLEAFAGGARAALASLGLDSEDGMVAYLDAVRIDIQFKRATFAPVLETMQLDPFPGFAFVCQMIELENLIFPECDEGRAFLRDGGHSLPCASSAVSETNSAIRERLWVT